MDDCLVYLATTMQQVLLLRGCGVQINNVNCHKSGDDIILNYKNVKCCVEPPGSIYIGFDGPGDYYTVRGHLNDSKTCYIIDVNRRHVDIIRDINKLCDALVDIRLIKVYV